MWFKICITGTQLCTSRIETKRWHCEYSRRIGRRLLVQVIVRQQPNNTWWPIGYGEQPLLDFTISLTPSGPASDQQSSQQSELHQRIGLKEVELVRRPVQQQPDKETFFFRMNGVDVYAKGSASLRTCMLMAFADLHAIAFAGIQALTHFGAARPGKRTTMLRMARGRACQNHACIARFASPLQPSGRCL